MPPVFLPDLRLNACLHGPDRAPALVMIHALGGSHHLWDGVIAQLPHHRILTMDLRGHGASDVAPAPYAMGQLIRDVERLMDHFALKDAVVIGVSLGGMIAQGLAVKRLDLVRGLVLSNTATRIGTAAQWQGRIKMLQDQGLAALTDATMERWLGRTWHINPAMPALRAAFEATDPIGWMGGAAAIAGTDFYQTTATLRLPTLAIAGSNDGSTPPDLVRETAGLIPGARFHLMQGLGHLPMAENPRLYAETLGAFLHDIGHI